MKHESKKLTLRVGPVLEFLFLFVSLFIWTACNPVKFNTIQKSEQSLSPASPTPPAPNTPPPAVVEVPPVISPPPPEPPPVIPPPPQKTYSEFQGICKDGDSISSCLKCINPHIPKPKPVPKLSSKAQKLAQIMALSCPIRNKSDPANYQVPPPYEIIKARLLACHEKVYPDSKVSGDQQQTLDRLLGPDPGMRQKIFSGLWYQPPHTDHFELYFGLESKEARRIFCYQDAGLSGDLMTSEYAIECLNSRDNCWAWQHNPAAQNRWREAQILRTQLKSCLDQPWELNPPPLSPSPPEKKCEFKIFEGTDLFRIAGQFEILKKAGFSLSIEDKKQCLQVTEFTDLSTEVRVSGYRCQ